MDELGAKILSGGSASSFWQGKTVLITGHSGFVGAWLTAWLRSQGAEIVGFSRGYDYPLVTVSAQLCRDVVYGDVRDIQSLSEVLRAHKPEVIFHLAAQPLVLRGYENPRETFETNFMGTVNVLEAIRQGSYRPESIVVITSDKVYRNDNSGRPFIEQDPLGGLDPYSASKAAADLATSSFQALMSKESNPFGIGIARAGNILGGGDWAPNRLVPDLIRSWSNGQAFRVRNPTYTRPWQYIMDAVAGYGSLAEACGVDATKSGAYNFGPPVTGASSVSTVLELARQFWYSGPGDVSVEGNAQTALESVHLSLDSTKATEVLDFENSYNLATTVEHTMEWYRRWLAGEQPVELVMEFIDRFERGS